MVCRRPASSTLQRTAPTHSPWPATGPEDVYVSGTAIKASSPTGSSEKVPMAAHRGGRLTITSSAPADRRRGERRYRLGPATYMLWELPMTARGPTPSSARMPAEAGRPWTITNWLRASPHRHTASRSTPAQSLCRRHRARLTGALHWTCDPRRTTARPWPLPERLLVSSIASTGTITDLLHGPNVIATSGN